METTPATGVARRRIIKRPRLTRMLDESRARIILLVAPAGYGKTTLAHEWLDERQAAWYRCGPASADVAALAVGPGNSDQRDRTRTPATACDKGFEQRTGQTKMQASSPKCWQKTSHDGPRTPGS